MIIQLTLFLTKFFNQFFLRFTCSFNVSSLLAFMLFRHFLKRILFFFHWKYPLCIKLDVSVETDFFSLFFFALIENNDNKLPKKSLHVHFHRTKKIPALNRRGKFDQLLFDHRQPGKIRIWISRSFDHVDYPTDFKNI